MQNLREQLCAEIKRMQGDKGYVLLAREGCDRIYAITYCPDECSEQSLLFEDCINAVRVTEDGCLQILCGIDTSDKDDQWIADHYAWWTSINSLDICKYTLLAIAENLYMYE